MPSFVCEQFRPLEYDGFHAIKPKIENCGLCEKWSRDDEKCSVEDVLFYEKTDDYIKEKGNFTRKLNEASDKIDKWPEWKKKALEGLK